MEVDDEEDCDMMTSRRVTAMGRSASHSASTGASNENEGVEA